jgi:hypothetical protein
MVAYNHCPVIKGAAMFMMLGETRRETNGTARAHDAQALMPIEPGSRLRHVAHA